MGGLRDSRRKSQGRVPRFSIKLKGTEMKHWNYNDGGRQDAGHKGEARDCVARAITIATGLPYQDIYERLAEGNATQRRGKYDSAASGTRSASKGIHTDRKWFKDLMQELGFTWHSTMQVGSGCKVHLRADDLPKGRLVCKVSRHCVAVIDGIIQDTHDCSRQGTRCVYGYWKLQEVTA